MKRVVKVLRKHASLLDSLQGLAESLASKVHALEQRARPAGLAGEDDISVARVVPAAAEDLAEVLRIMDEVQLEQRRGASELHALRAEVHSSALLGAQALQAGSEFLDRFRAHSLHCQGRFDYME